MTRSTASAIETDRFSAFAEQWWDPCGPLRTLHDLMPLRTHYVSQQLSNKTYPKRKGLSFNKEPFAGLRVLDIGCGGGLMSEYLARHGATVMGVDPAAAALEAAQAHAKKQGLLIDYRCGDAETILRDEGHESFDAIIAFEVVEHVSNLSGLMQTLTKLLKPEGRLIISTVNRTKRSFLFGIIAAEYVLGWVPQGTHDWDHFVKPSEMETLWVSYGLEAIDLTGAVFRPLSGRFEPCQGRVAVNYFMTGQKKGRK